MSSVLSSSLQEVAPMSYAFIGSYFLSPYHSRFEEALNLAAIQVESSKPSTPTDGDVSHSTSPAGGSNGNGNGRLSWFSKSPRGPYQLIQAANVGMTSILMFARHPAAIHHIQVAETGFGIGDMGNKGAVGIRITYGDAGIDGNPGENAEHRTTELTFVAAHLAAMEWNKGRRNSNWRSIVSGLLFENPKKVVEGLDGLGRGLKGRQHDSAASAAHPDLEGYETDDEHQRLLSSEQAAQLREHHDTLRDISIFRPTSHLFIAGDFNYRIASKTPPPLATFPSPHDDDEDNPNPNHWRGFLGRDQLREEQAAGRTFHGLSEAPIAFPPSYKFDILDEPEGAVNEAEVRAWHAAGKPGNAEVVPWKYAPHRWPSWCDRVLFLDVPGWARRRLGLGKDDKAAKIDVQTYASLPVMRSSDHQPVYVRARVPLLNAEELALPASAERDAEESGELVPADAEEALTEEERLDPRVKMPVNVDVDAWERRATVRRREIALGCSMFLWSTREGAVLIGTLLLVGVGSWWASQGLLG